MGVGGGDRLRPSLVVSGSNCLLKSEFSFSIHKVRVSMNAGPKRSTGERSRMFFYLKNGQKTERPLPRPRNR